MDYQKVYDLINEFGEKERYTKKHNWKSSAREGVRRATMRKIMAHLNWVWTPTMQIGSGCTVHLTKAEMPEGRIVVGLSKHYTVMIDGVIYDDHDPSRGGLRCVYGYWKKE